MVSADISSSYQEQANAIKLLLPDGDIDFIVAASVIPGEAPEMIEVDGRSIALDPTSEILGKKLLYRADGFKARDVFDLAVVLDLEPEAAVAALNATRHSRPALMRRLAAMHRAPEGDLVRDLLMTETGERHAPGMVAKVLKAIEAVDAA